jgi:microcystin-dependent protein
LDSVPFADQSSSGNKKKATLQTVIDLARASIIPAGIGPLPYAGGTAPTGWLWCQGQAVSRTTYAALFAAIGTTWGAGDGSSTFNVPDPRGRAVIGEGSGAGLTARAIGATTGTETHTLTTAEMPAHTHPYEARVGEIGGGGGGAFQTGATRTTSSTGGGAAHNNMQPSVVAKMIISY